MANKYGLEPDSYADLKTNHPQMDKTRSSGQAPANPFEGVGSPGYEEKNMPLYWVAAHDYSVRHDPPEYEGEPGWYVIDNFGIFADNIVNAPTGTTGVFVVNGKEYKAVKAQEYAGTVMHEIRVYEDGASEYSFMFMQWDNQFRLEDTIASSFFPEIPEGQSDIVEISSYYIGKDLDLEPNFKKAVSKVANITYLGISYAELGQIQSDIPAESDVTIYFKNRPLVGPEGATHYKVSNGPAGWPLMTNELALHSLLNEGWSATFMNTSASDISASTFNESTPSVTIEFYKITED